jgi:hypothetical protein
MGSLYENVLLSNKRTTPMTTNIAPATAQPGDYVLKDIAGRVIRISISYMSAGPAKLYRVNNDRTLERLFWA